MTAPTGLARVTISAPQRRVDVALPEHVPVAELLPELLAHAGEALSDEGETHGGWVLRRATGERVSSVQGLQQQGVRDGEILHLVPARAQWPELEYDDVVEAIAAGTRRIGQAWSPEATRVAAVVGAGLALTIGLFALWESGTQGIVALAVCVLLILAGLIASRGYRERLAGAGLAGYSLPFAFLGGALLVTGGPARLLAGSTALLLAAAAAAVAVAAGHRVLVAGMAAGALGVLAAVLAFWLPAKGAAAIVLSALACGIGVIPLLAIRLGKLPIPPVTLPAGQSAVDGTLEAVRERPARDRVQAAVRRTGDVLTGMLLAHAVATAVASVVLVREGGAAGRLLAGVAGLVLLLRSRLFATLRQRVPVLAAGLASLAAVATGVVAGAGAGRPGAAVVVAAVALALVVISAGFSYAKRPPSPYVGQAADVIDLVLVVSVVPIACAVLDLYSKVRGLT